MVMAQIPQPGPATAIGACLRAVLRPGSRDSVLERLLYDLDVAERCRKPCSR
jgi:hypothetical protein